MPTYLDMAATTPVDARVADLVFHHMTREFGNAGSRTHGFGAAALDAVSNARTQVARSVGADPSEVVFTSGATEADNLAILGLRDFGRSSGRRHIVSTAIEHKAVLEPLEHLEATGFEVTLVKPDASGYVSPDDVLAAVRPDTLLVSVMHANNETGAVQPITAVADQLPGDGPFFHVDAAQTFGRLNEQLANARIDLISLSAHKIHAPKGVGALIVRRRDGRRVPLSPLMYGGGQERGLRPGTVPVPLVAGFGLASALAQTEAADRERQALAIRNAALAAFAPLAPHVHGNSARGVLPHVLSMAFPGVDSEALMVAANDLVAISNGSACTSSSYQPSHVLEAMNLPPDIISGTIRLSWSYATGVVPWDELARRVDDLRLSF